MSTYTMSKKALLAVSVALLAAVSLVGCANLKTFNLAPRSQPTQEPTIPLGPGETVPPFTGLDVPIGVAVNGAGDLYVTDTRNNNRVLTLAAGSTTPTVLPFTGFQRTYGVAVDAAGSLYVTDAANHRVVKLAAAALTSAA